MWDACLPASAQSGMTASAPAGSAAVETCATAHGVTTRWLHTQAIQHAAVCQHNGHACTIPNELRAPKPESKYQAAGDGHDTLGVDLQHKISPSLYSRIASAYQGQSTFAGPRQGLASPETAWTSVQARETAIWEPLLPQKLLPALRLQGHHPSRACPGSETVATASVLPPCTTRSCRMSTLCRRSCTSLGNSCSPWEVRPWRWVSMPHMLPATGLPRLQ